MRTRTTLATLATLATLGVLVSGCGAAPEAQTTAQSSTSPSSAGGDHSDEAMGDGSMGDGMDMDMGGAHGPSEPASMICGSEIQEAVQRTFAMSSKPSSTHTWSTSRRLFSCTYRVPRAKLAMSVQDATGDKAGRPYFDRLRGQLSGAHRLNGMQNFGFPAFSTPSGTVVFLKDGKTLRVDATKLPSSALPQGFSREDTAFSVASAVIACWTE
jgi:hypothetical protein